MFPLSSPDSDCFAGSRESQNTMITMPINIVWRITSVTATDEGNSLVLGYIPLSLQFRNS